ncbi:MAG TPA: Ig-like domain-containing protein [Gemmatimonadaceae bacterium]|nr:Ig-like domain-containing protein [Gemmatimonadaceae bacterium]
MSRFSRSPRYAALLAATLALAACGDDPGAPAVRTPASIALQVPAGDVYENDVVELRAVVRDQRGAVIPDAAVSWSASSAARAEVGPDGATTFLAPGAVTVTASLGAVSASHPFDVKRLSVLQVTVASARPLMVLGELLPVGVHVQGEGGRTVIGRAVTLSSENPDIVAIDDAGRARALKAGTATLRATVEGVTGSARVQVVGDDAILSLSRVGGARLPLLVDADSTSWDGVREYHEVYIEGGRFIVTAGDAPRYAIEVRYAEYRVDGPPGARRYTLRATWRDRDFGVVSGQANGALTLTSEYVWPLQHTATGVTDGMQVRYRVAGTNDHLDLLYRRE